MTIDRETEAAAMDKAIAEFRIALRLTKSDATMRRDFGKEWARLASQSTAKKAVRK